MLGETNLEWIHVRKIRSKSDFIPSNLNFATGALSAKQVKPVNTRYLEGNDQLDCEAVMRSSKACGPLYKWAESQVKYSYVFNQRTSPDTKTGVPTVTGGYGYGNGNRRGRSNGSTQQATLRRW